MSPPKGGNAVCDQLRLASGVRKNKTTQRQMPSKYSSKDFSSFKNVTVSPSKALPVLFTKMRDVNTSSADFVKYSKRAMRILIEDALVDFPLGPANINTPCGPFDGLCGPDPESICAVSIIRSGDCLLEAAREVEPSMKVGKILIQRDESHPDKIAKLFYDKMPPGMSDNTYVLLCDPMLATGGSSIKALEVLCGKHKVDPAKIVFANMICCPEGLEALALAYPEVKVVTACIDDGLNEEKFIVPGLGDYGDRFFNT